MSAQTGNTTARCLQALVRVLAGAGTVKLGLYDESAGTFVGTAIHDGYDARTIINGQTPADTDCTLCLEVPNGVTIRWIAQDRQTAATSELPIPNWQTAATATRTNEYYTTTYAVTDDTGSIECCLTPLGWTGVVGANTRALSQAVSGRLIYARSSAAGWASYDGSSVVQETTSPTDGVEQCLRIRWFGNVRSIDVDGNRVSGAYDGTHEGSGVLVLGDTTTSSAVEVAYRNLIVYRNGDG